jgi:hypothetical protein
VPRQVVIDAQYLTDHISPIHASGHLSASLAIRLGFGLEHHGCGDLLGQSRTYFLRIAVAGLMAPITATSVFGIIPAMCMYLRKVDFEVPAMMLS